MADIRVVDCNYLGLNRFAASYLLTDGEEAAFVDNNTARAVPELLKALGGAGFSPEQVRYVIVTHVHLDHSGGSHELMKACPNAVLLAHPRAAGHITDPSKLVGSALAVYGEKRFREWYGEVLAVDPARVESVEDGGERPFGASSLSFLHTRGHANHHFCIHWPEKQAVFSGDSFGLRYPDLQKDGLFIFPSTSPTAFIPGEAVKSVERIVGTGAKSVYPTHYGEVARVAEAAAQLTVHLEEAARLMERARDSDLTGEALAAYCREETEKYYRTYLSGRGFGEVETMMKYIELDTELNGQGVAFSAEKARGRA